ncbi:MAG: tetratricopeptide repeat protein, partial [Nitrospira sp.]|nr:tetratricopeptide repeat protein [Nitrospira sp.]
GGPYLLYLLGVKEKTERLSILSPEAIKYRTFEVLRQMVLKRSNRQSVLVVVEDLHWIDKTSEEYFASLVESLAKVRILLLCTYRPEYRLPWAGKPYVTQLTLRRLTPEDSLRIVHSVFQEKTVLEPLSQVILGKAEGNPFFLEELAQTVVGQGGFHPNVTIPNTIQGVLMARIDRLPDDAKQVLQTASVLGREFSLRLLDVIWDGTGAPGPYLVKLKRLEFLHEKTRTPEPVYVFKHALTQEVAYESLLTTRRRALHAAVGRALETLYADRLEEVYDRIAYHYAKTEETAKAVGYLTRFAERAAKGYSHEEAIKTLQEALAHVERLPTEEQDHCLLNLVFRQIDSLRSLGRIQESLDLLLQQQERLERLQDPSLAGLYYFWLGHTYGLLGDEERSMQYLQRALEEAEQCGDQATLGKIYYVMALEEPHTQAVEHGRQAVALLEQVGERDWLGMAYWIVGVNSLQVGEFKPALEAAARARVIGEAIEDSRLQSYAAWTTGIIYATMGEWGAGIEACKQGLERSPDPLSKAIASGYLGYAYLQKGDAAQAIPVLEQSVQQMSQFQWRQAQGWFMAYLSEAYLLSGQIEKAQDLAMQSLEIGRDAGYGWVMGCAEWDLGRIAQTKGNFSEAEIHLQEALKNFSGMKMRFEVGRTYLALAKLAHTQGNMKTAAQRLREAHDLFKVLQVPKYIERTEQLARKLEVPFPENA